MPEKIVYIVAPGGAVGGGMGRVKDYILQSPLAQAGPCRFLPLVTRDERGAGFSLLLLMRAILLIWWARITGRLAFVHVNFGDKGSAARKGLIILACKIAGAPCLLHLHAAELVEFYAAGSPLRRFALRLPFRLASSIVVLGQLWRDWLIRDLGIDPARIDVLYNGVPVTPSPRDFRQQPDAPRQIMFLGLLSERKGISDFLAALAALPAGAPAWRAVVAGNGDIEGYRNKAAALGIGDRVEFTGWVGQAEVRQWLRAVDMMVLPSYHEGLPLVILEALGCGTPVITTPIGAIPEVLVDKRDVLLVTPGDRPAIAAAMLSLLEDREAQQALSDRGLERFCQRFTIEAFLADLGDIYNRRFGLAFAAPARLAERVA